MNEIPNHPGYFADIEGNIYSVRSGTLRKLSKRMHRGYYRVHLRNEADPKQRLSMDVHTLVLNTYVGPKPPDNVCRHLNGNPLDNRLDNLCWGTPQENVQDSIRHGTAVCLRHGERAVGSKLKISDIREIKKLYSEGHLQKEIASAFSISQHHVSDIVNGKTWCKDV